MTALWRIDFTKRALQMLAQRLAGFVYVSAEDGLHQGFVSFDEMLGAAHFRNHDVAITARLIKQQVLHFPESLGSAPRRQRNV